MPTWPASATLGALYDHPEVRRYLQQPNPGQLRQLLDEAEALCLAQLAGAEAS
jgi:hypothetical protein